MTAQQATISQRSAREDTDVNTTAAGWAMFAGAIMIVVGFFQALEGFVAIFSGDFFVMGQQYIFSLDTTTWGWWHMIWGIVVTAAGFGLFSGATWARTLGIFLAVVSAITNFMFIPYYPFWSLMIIALDIAVIWGISNYGREEAKKLSMGSTYA